LGPETNNSSFYSLLCTVVVIRIYFTATLLLFFYSHSSIASQSCSDICGWLWIEWWYLSKVFFGIVGVADWSLRHIMFPLWLFGIPSHSCVLSVPTSTRSVVCLELLFENSICLLVAFWRPEAHLLHFGFLMASLGQAETGKQHKGCRSLFFYLFASFYYHLNGKTSTTNKRTVIWYQFGTLCSKSKLRTNGTKVLVSQYPYSRLPLGSKARL
jgi:hypothetical protein